MRLPDSLLYETVTQTHETPTKPPSFRYDTLGMSGTGELGLAKLESTFH